MTLSCMTIAFLWTHCSWFSQSNRSGVAMEQWGLSSWQQTGSVVASGFLIAPPISYFYLGGKWLSREIIYREGRQSKGEELSWKNTPQNVTWLTMGSLTWTHLHCTTSMQFLRGITVLEHDVTITMTRPRNLSFDSREESLLYSCIIQISFHSSLIVGYHLTCSLQ